MLSWRTDALRWLIICSIFIKNRIVNKMDTVYIRDDCPHCLQLQQDVSKSGQSFTVLNQDEWDKVVDVVPTIITVHGKVYTGSCAFDYVQQQGPRAAKTQYCPLSMIILCLILALCLYRLFLE